MSIKKILLSMVIVGSVVMSGLANAANLYSLPSGKAVQGRVTTIYPVMGKDGMSVDQYNKFQRLGNRAAQARSSGQSSDSIGNALSSSLGSLMSGVKSSIGIQDTNTGVRMTVQKDHSRDNDPYAQPEDYESALGNGVRGYRVRSVLSNGDIFNLYVTENQYNQLVSRGLQRGSVIQVVGGNSDNNLTTVLNP